MKNYPRKKRDEGQQKQDRIQVQAHAKVKPGRSTSIVKV